MKNTKILTLLIAIFLIQIGLASALTITSVTSNPAEVQPGETLTLNLKIENDLSQDIEDVVVSLDLNTATNPKFAPYLSSNEYVIEEISKNDEEKASFDLITLSEVTSGIYTIPVQISYRLANETNRSSQGLGLVSVSINAKPKIELSSESLTLIKGTKGEIKIKIINSGMGESKFLNIRLNPANGIKITGLDNIYIGNIDSNDFDSADFEVFINANAPSLITLPLELTYTDSMNNQITETQNVPIKVYSQKEAIELGLAKKDNTFLIVISILGLIAAYLGYRKIKKRNKNKRDNPQ